MTDDNKTTPAVAPGLDLDAVDIMPKPGETWHTGEDLALLLAAARAEIARLTAEHRAILDAEIAESNQAVADLRGEIARLTAELAELAAARAVPADVEAAIARVVRESRDGMRIGRVPAFAASEGGSAVAILRTAIARAISDATAARWTVGGLLATAPVGSIVEYMDADGSAWHQVEFNATMTAHRLRIASWGSWKQRDMPQRELRQPARLVPADQADLDPATRGPLPKGG